MTSKRFVDSSLVIVWLFNFKSLLFDVNSIKCILPKISDNILIFNNGTNLQLTLTLILFRLSPSIKTLVSSANSIRTILSDTLTISLTYNRNRIEPCVTSRKIIVLAVENYHWNKRIVYGWSYNYLSIHLQHPLCHIFIKFFQQYMVIHRTKSFTKIQM